jgi:hypothetical protein
VRKITLLRLSSGLFDKLEARWELSSTRRLIASALVLAFLSSVFLIELSRLGWLTSVFGYRMPTNHLHAISWVMTFLLIAEILDLVFALAASVANALGKQLEIVALILLRKAFDELPHFPEPVTVTGHIDSVWSMAAQAGGSLVLFGLLLVFYRLQKHESTFRDARHLSDFIDLKKFVSLLLLLAFAVVSLLAGIDSLTLPTGSSRLSLRFFEVFFTLLIFADVLIALASTASNRGFRVVFRNFGFALVTVILRLGLSADPGVNALIVSGAGLLSVAISYAFIVSKNLIDNLDQQKS